MGKGRLWPFAQAHHPELMGSPNAFLPFLFGICLHLFAYRELGPSVSEEGVSPSQTNRGDAGKMKKGHGISKAVFNSF